MSTLNGGPGNIVTNGLVLYLDAANYQSYISGSTTWNDLSGNNNSGSLVNGPTFSSTNAGSIVFDGIDDYVSESNFTGSIVGSFTIGVWINFTDANTPAYQKIFHAQTGSGAYSEVNLDNYNGGSGNARYHFYTHRSDNTSTNDILTSNFTITNNVWAYMTGVYDNSTKFKFLYLNGIVNSSGSTTNQITWPNSATWLGRRLSSAEPLNGKIASVQTYNRALTASEVLQNYNATKARFGL